MKKQTRAEDLKLKINLEWPNILHDFLYPSTSEETLTFDLTMSVAMEVETQEQQEAQMELGRTLYLKPLNSHLEQDKGTGNFYMRKLIIQSVTQIVVGRPFMCRS